MLIGDILDREYPDAKCALHYETPEQLLFATMLSAQCTDVLVNKTTPALFKSFPSVKEMARAKLEQVEKSQLYLLAIYLECIKNMQKPKVGKLK